MTFSVSGSLVAIVTPMTEEGLLDLPAYEALIHWHIEQGTDAIVAVGTSGESPTVNVEEHLSFIEHWHNNPGTLLGRALLLR